MTLIVNFLPGYNAPDHMDTGLQLGTIERVDNINKAEFYDQYLKPQRPVIIRKLASDWPAMKKWTPEFFRDVHGSKLVKVYDGSFVKPGRNYMSSVKEIPFRDYIEEVLNKSQDLRMFLYNIKSEIPELIDDLQLPDFASGCSSNFIFMFFGCKASTTQMHFDIDMAHVFHTSFIGRKTITLYPYEQGKNIYRYPFTCRSYVDIHNPDFKKYPRLRVARGYRDVVAHGETLFIPSGYWHHIIYNEPSFAVSLRCRHQSLLKKVHGYYNIFIMSTIDRVLNKLIPKVWFQWKQEKALM